ncbi:dethiobiotin synthase [Ulvibacter litoralis]|uniref:ATP-dependent dethiobiotin synthetase BioD n=1 Tax=Ulvibacter litoralis TaxID=227084 RepID=A0A1G7CV69_9FLAO|nr:dethiobiotin synthase [Ulvibacter litoralis]GHC45907.1 ATP-dependent dethiobiotin synthetase BioD [Ulvibacter litoralis]SDE43242.1 dethiobiotin synthetase [Ulvibacter litoralis]
MKETYFITGIGTDVGKTIAASILTETLQADYWKPIQAGDLDTSDTHKVKALVSNTKTKFHPSAFNLNTPMSPHAAAQLDGITIEAKKIKRPTTQNKLVIEGAGGLLVPINNSETVLDLIQPKDKVIVVSRHYLGSINHTLLTIEVLKQRGLSIFGILFNGDENPSTETIIAEMSGVAILGRIEEEPYFDANVVREYASRLETLDIF